MKDRYSRQMLFKPVGEQGQKRIEKGHVMIFGCGALGTASAETLARAGVGKLTIIDRDYVEGSNLQRQQLFSESDAIQEMPKAIAAKKRLSEINSDILIDSHVMDATGDELIPLLKDVDVVIDATDNFDVRLMMNDLFHKLSIPWIFGSCVGSTGMSFTILTKQTPCLNCLLSSGPISGATCDSAGIIAPAVQIVAAHQTTEALKMLVGDTAALRTKLITFDLWNNQHQMINVSKAKKDDCKACGEFPSYEYLTDEKKTRTEVLCGRETVQIRSRQPLELSELEKRLQVFGEVRKNNFLLSLRYQNYRLVFFHDGRTLIHGTHSVKEAKKIYYQLIG
ncbi:MoeB/ThiF family adenylyltransferase [Halobacillus aidingensis]|nr:MoeB/ThiF family adenylyltransferase [Halobacillus aidingensis]